MAVKGTNSNVCVRSWRGFVLQLLLTYRNVACKSAAVCFGLALVMKLIDILCQEEVEEDHITIGFWQNVISWLYKVKSSEIKDKSQPCQSLSKQLHLIFNSGVFVLHAIGEQILNIGQFCQKIWVSTLIQYKNWYLSNPQTFLLCMLVILILFIGFPLSVCSCYLCTWKLKKNGDNLAISHLGVGRRYLYSHFCKEDVPRKRFSVRKVCLYLVLLGALSSIPWEFLRLYQNEVAKKAAVTSAGLPPECLPSQMSMWQSIKSWLLWQMSWDHTPCEKYHHALLVDPLWEVTPMMVLSSVVTRCFTKPVEICCSSLGRSFRLLFREIPSPWQPVVMIILVSVSLVMMIMICSYRVSFPLFLKIEPSKRTPIIVKGCPQCNTLQTTQTSRSHKNRNSCLKSLSYEKASMDRTGHPFEEQAWWDGSLNDSL